VNYNRRIYYLLYISIIASFIATLITYNLPRGIEDIARRFLPVRYVKHINFALSSYPIDFSNLTISFIGILITFSIFAGIGLLLIRRRNDAQG